MISCITRGFFAFCFVYGGMCWNSDGSQTIPNPTRTTGGFDRWEHFIRCRML